MALGVTEARESVSPRWQNCGQNMVCDVLHTLVSCRRLVSAALPWVMLRAGLRNSKLVLTQFSEITAPFGTFLRALARHRFASQDNGTG